MMATVVGGAYLHNMVIGGMALVNWFPFFFLLFLGHHDSLPSVSISCHLVFSLEVPK